MWPTPQSFDATAIKRSPEALARAKTKGWCANLREAVEVSDVLIASSQLTLFAEAFPVSRTRSLVDVADLTMSATSGLSSSDSFASLNPDGSWRKTCQGYSQVTLDGSLARFSETWPRAGMTRNGIAYQRQPSAPLTDVTESGSWPTPTVADTFGTTANHPRKEANFETGHAVTLAQVVHHRQQWPTPTSNDTVGAGYQKGKNGARFFTLPGAARASTGQPYDKAASGQLNPTWVEWLMGYPTEWTALEGWEIRSSRKSPNGSPNGSRKRNTVNV
jgi:DNA (cytosine-5)-methyltransferase 1